MSRKALGRGIDALFRAPVEGTPGDAADRPEMVSLPLDRIIASPDQPRRTFDDEGIRELAESMKRQGVLQPVIVTPAEGDRYTLVAGERRWRAAQLAGLSSVPAVVRRVGERERLEIALIENLQRSDLDPIEEAQAYRRLMDLAGAGQEEVARLIGKDRSTVANSLRLLRLSPEIQEALSSGRMSAGHARAILSVGKSADQKVLQERILSQGLSVRQAEELASRLNQGGRAVAGSTEEHERKRRDPTLHAVEKTLFDRLGTKVEIRGDRKSGRIEIRYYTADDLDRIVEILSGR
jgi:ParB family chromosome partitioning protein